MSDFPAIIEGQGDLAAFLSVNKQAVDAALSDAGTLLFRGFDVPDAQAFDSAVEGYGEVGFTYEESLSNAVRVNVTPRVFTANEAPPTTEIHLHHEMAQTPLFPSKLFFYCEIAPEEGGATPFCRSDWLLERMAEQDAGLVARFAEHGVRYTNVMPGADDAGSGQGRSWRSTLGVVDRAGAEKRLADLGYAWEWREDDSLRATTPVLQGVRELPSGRKAFFNQLIAACRGWKDSRNDASKAITLGDGTPLDVAAVQKAIDLSERFTVDVPWQAGDVVLIDNYAAMHGRCPFEGKRAVLAALVKGEVLKVGTPA